METSQNAGDKLLNIKELCEMLTVSKATIYKAMIPGRCPDFPRPRKILASRRWVRSEVQAWLDLQKVAA